MASCKQCRAWFVWTVDHGGRFVPVDGKTFSESDARLRYVQSSRDESYQPLFDPSIGHVAHYETCPVRKSHDRPPPRPPPRRDPPPPKPPKPPPPDDVFYNCDGPPLSAAYAELELNSGAHAEVVKAAYRALARVHHPDVGGDAEKMRRLNVAFEALQKAGRA